MSFSDIGPGNISTIRPQSGPRAVAAPSSDPNVRRGTGAANPSPMASLTPSFSTGSAISSNPYSASAYAANVGADEGIGELGSNLRKFQTDLTFLNNRIGEMKRRCSVQEKADAEKQLKNLKEFEDMIQNQIDDQLRRLDSLPRAESAQKRHALIKLQKDFDRVRPFVQTMIRDCAGIKAVNYSGFGPNSASAPAGGRSADGGGSRNDAGSGSNSNAGSSKSREPILIQATVQDVDELILEERERDIMKINRDIVLVNEMFKDMADIIEKQGVMIEEIHTSTEESRVRAEAGLEQVKQAADYQPVCVIS